MNSPAPREESAPMEALAALGERVYQGRPLPELREALCQLTAAEEGAWPFPLLCEALALGEAEAYGVALCVGAEAGAVPALTPGEWRELCGRAGSVRGGVQSQLFELGGAGVQLRPLARGFLAGAPPRLESGAQLLFPEKEDLHDPLLLGELARFARHAAGAGEPAVILLEGEPGSGRTYLFRRLAAELGGMLLCLPAEAARQPFWDEARLCAALYGALVCLKDPAPGQSLDGPAREAGLLLAAVRPGKGPATDPRCPVLQRRVRPLAARAARRRVESLLGALPVEPDPPPGAVDALCRLGAGALRQWERQVRAEHWATGEAVTWATAGVWTPARGSFAGPGVSVLQSGFRLGDMVLTGRQRLQLRRICDFAGAWGTVYRDWGFARKVPWGQGITALFYGPPGTGKTMAATAVANELGLPLYRVDLSQMISKYVGETQKNIGRIFDDAADSGGILFFDEADALFSRRSEAGDSQDKYANAEVAYLLQRTEGHGGLCILATNLLQNFDEAFRRRITYMISFPLPDAVQRRSIWENIFPDRAPVENLDAGLLAREFELSGASIKSCAVHAAYRAACEGGAITMERILDGVREEYAKQGKQLPPQFAGWLAEQ